jgi:hypothetical protein
MKKAKTTASRDVQIKNGLKIRHYLSKQQGRRIGLTMANGDHVMRFLRGSPNRAFDRSTPKCKG